MLLLTKIRNVTKIGNCFVRNYMESKEMFCLADYDAYGFDLDHTIAKYKLVNLIRLAYESLCDSLIEQMGYDSKLKDDIEIHKDFICKGLFLDSEKGNILKLSHDGKILRGSHGTRMMDKSELISEYGENLHWEHFEEAIGHVKSLGRGMKYRFFENYFDIPALITSAHIVDIQDMKNGKPSEKYNFWQDVYSAFKENYIPSQFAKNAGWYFPGIKKEPSRYLQPCSAGVKEWLLELKQQNKVVFLMTSSASDYAGLVAESVLGSDWQKYFDIYLTNAKKPAFFTEDSLFHLVENGDEKNAVKDLESHKIYSGGNYHDLMKYIAKQTGKKEPKVVYFGDSLCSDSFPSKTFANWDVVLVLEEMEAEGYHPTVKDVLDARRREPQHEVNLYIDPEEERYILSDCWGSFFYHPEEDPKHDKHMNTYWGRIISKYNAIAVPTVEYIAGMPISHQYKRFGADVGNSDGFYPGKPKPLL